MVTKLLTRIDHPRANSHPATRRQSRGSPTGTQARDNIVTPPPNECKLSSPERRNKRRPRQAAGERTRRTRITRENRKNRSGSDQSHRKRQPAGERDSKPSTMATPSTPKRAIAAADKRPLGPHTAGKLNQKRMEAKHHAGKQQPQPPKANHEARAPQGGGDPAQCGQGSGKAVTAEPKHRNLC